MEINLVHLSITITNFFPYIIVIVNMLFAFRAFIVYVVKSTCKEEEAVFNRMMR